jgi:hypothetical protein
VFDGGVDGSADGARVGADESGGGLHDVAVDEEGVHVSALDVEGDVAVGVEQRADTGEVPLPGTQATMADECPHCGQLSDGPHLRVTEARCQEGGLCDSVVTRRG